MFDIKNEQKRKDAYNYITQLVGDFYGSSVYAKYYDRCMRRLKMYYMRPETNQPVWRSKLYFATFFLACKALGAALSQSIRQDPITQVGLEDGLIKSADTLERAALAHYDLNHDLYVSRWRETHDAISWYMEVFGVGVGREYVVSDVNEENNRRIIEDQYGMRSESMESLISRNEHTKTDAVHPLNFAHDVTVGDFWQSRWASVRYPLPISSIYKMLGDDNYYQPGVKELLEKVTKGESPEGWESSKETYYCENASDQFTKNSVIVDEYSGDLNFAGNYDDNDLYFCLIVKKYDVILRMSKTPFRRHPYWKERAYPDPTGPYGVDPNAAIVPITYLKNSTFNQYVDHTNASLKTMYELYDGNIRGGVMSLITGQPHGFVIADTEEAYLRGPLVRPVQKDRGGIAGVSDILGFIEKYEQQARPSSIGRGKDESLNDTATAIGYMAQREDATIAFIQDKVNAGMEDCFQMKLQNRIDFMTQPVTGQVKQGSPPVRYFPFELAGQRYTQKVQRITPDVQAGKYMSYLKLIVPFLNPAYQGVVNVNGISRLLKIVGRNVGIDEIDEIVNEPPPVSVNTQPTPGSAGGAPAGQQAPGSEAGMPELPKAPSPEQMGSGAPNAMASMAA